MQQCFHLSRHGTGGYRHQGASRDRQHVPCRRARSCQAFCRFGGSSCTFVARIDWATPRGRRNSVCGGGASTARGLVRQIFSRVFAQCDCFLAVVASLSIVSVMGPTPADGFFSLMEEVKPANSLVDALSGRETRPARWPGPRRRRIRAQPGSDLSDAQIAEDGRPILLDNVAASSEPKPHSVAAKGLPGSLLRDG